MSLRCIHLSDIHFRGLSRHEEYRESFEKFFSIAKDLKPNMIFLGGDIVHSKTQGISPELIDSTVENCLIVSFDSIIKSFSANSSPTLYGWVFLNKFEELKSKS